MIRNQSLTRLQACLLLATICPVSLFFSKADAESLIGSIKNVPSKIQGLKDQWKLIPDQGLQLKVKEGEPVTLKDIPGFGEIKLPQSLATLFNTLKITDLHVFGSKKLLDIQGTSTMFGSPIYLHIRIAKKGLSTAEKTEEIAVIKKQIEAVTEDTFAEYYAELELTPTATKQEVKKAYRKLALKWHPDKASPDLVDEYTEKMKKINAAYAQVKDREPSTDTDATTTPTTASSTEKTTSPPLAIEGPANTAQASSYDWTFLIDIPETFRLTKISEVFKPVDFEIRQGTFALSNVRFEDEKAGTIEAGLTFAGQFIAHGELEKMLTMVGSNLNQVTLSGLITPRLTGSYLKTTIPGRIKFGDKAETTGLTLGIRVIEVAPGVKAGELLMNTGLQVMFPHQAPVVFSAEIAAGPTEASLTGSMAGTITIPNTGLYIGNVIVKSTINYAAAAASGGLLALSGLGFGGTLGVGSREINLALYMAVNALLASGEFTGGLYLADIVSLFNNKQLDKDYKAALPNIGIDRIKVEIASQDMVFNNTPYEAGGLFEGEGVILDSKARLKAHFTPKKLSINGHIEPITIGPLTITGAGEDGKMGTEDDGAYLDILVNPTASDIAHIFRGIIDGQVILLFGADTISAYTRIELQPTTAVILFDFLLADIFTTKLDAKIDLITPKKSHIDLLMEQSALDKLGTLLKKAANDLLESYGTKARRAVEIRRRACEGLPPFLETKPYRLASETAQAAVTAAPNGDYQALQAFVRALETNKAAMLEQVIPTLPPGDAIEYAWELLLINLPTLKELIDLYREDPNRMHSIWAATSTNKEWGVQRVLELLKKGVSVDTEDTNGYTLLMLAAKYANKPLVDLLITQNAQVNKARTDGTTALIYALHSPSITKKLVTAGADVNAQDAHGKAVLDYALETAHPDAFATIVEAGAGGGKAAVTALLTERFANALKKNDADMVARITASGYFDILARDTSGRTTVIQAIQEVSDAKVRPAIVTTLLLVDGNTHNLANLADTKGGTPLVHAIQAGDLHTVEALVRYGANPWQKVNGKIPRDYASNNKELIAALSAAMEATPQEALIQPSKKTTTLRSLLDAQAKYLKTYKKTKTPNEFRAALSSATPEEINFVGDGVDPLLITAIQNGDYIAVRDLLEFKADPNLVWKEKSALAYALDKKESIKKGYPTTNIERIIQDLKNAGAVE